MERKKRLIGFLEEENEDKDAEKPSSNGENPDGGQEEELSPKDAEKQFLQQKIKEFQQKKEQEEQIADTEKQKTIDRFNKIHSKLGRLLATPLELAKLDKEREEDEKLERESEDDYEDSELDEAKKATKQPVKKVTKQPVKKVTKQPVKKASEEWWNRLSSTAQKEHLQQHNDPNEKGTVAYNVAHKGWKVKGSDETDKKEKNQTPKPLSKKPDTKAAVEQGKQAGTEEAESQLQQARRLRGGNKKPSKKGELFPTDIAGKSKALDQKRKTELQKAFVDKLYNFKKGDKDFLQNNKKYQMGKKSIDLSLSKEYFIPKSIKELIASGKVPQREIQILLRMINSQQASSTQPPISYFTDGGPGGAGKLQAQCGELMTLCCVAMTKKQREDFRQSIYKHIENNPGKKMISTKDWVDAACNNSDAIHARIQSEFKVDDATKLITHACWDVAYDVEALGMDDYKKNKGYSTDIFIKLKLPSGQKILNEVSLKKDKNVNFLNSSTGKFETWDKNLSDDLKPSTYQNNLLKLLKRPSGNIINDKELHQLISDKKMLSNKKSKAYQLKQIMEKLDIKSLNEIEGNSRAERKLLFLALEAKAESSPNGPVAKKVDEIRKASIDYSTRAILAIKDNPALSKGMISSIRKEFPLRAVCDNEETMAIGKVSVDKKVMEHIFGTSDWKKIQDHLVTITDAVPPYLAYRVGKEGSRQIPVAILNIREDGVGYGGQFKLELKLHGKFYTTLEDANKNLYGTQFPTKRKKQNDSIELMTFSSMLLEYMEECEYDDFDLVDDLEEKVYDDLEEKESKLRIHFETYELVEDD